LHLKILFFFLLENGAGPSNGQVTTGENREHNVTFRDKITNTVCKINLQFSD